MIRFGENVLDYVVELFLGLPVLVEPPVAHEIGCERE